MDINQVNIKGRAGRDAEVRHTTKGTAVASFSVATGGKSKDGKEFTEWHNVTAWGGWADYAARAVTKGAEVWIQGRLSTRKYTGRDGTEKTTTEVIVENMLASSGKPALDAEPVSDDEVPF